MAKTRAELLNAATIANAAGRLDEAEKAAQEILASDPSDVEAMLVLAIIRFRSNDLPPAAETLQRILEVDPTSFDAPFWLSAVRRRQDKPEEALAMARYAVERDGRNEHALNQLGMCLLDLNQGEPAVECFQRAIELAPNAGPIYDNLGKALQSLGRNTEAIRAFRKVLAVGPVKIGGLLRLAEAYLSVSNYQGVAQCAESVLQMHPNSLPGNLLLARALIGDGRVAEGARYAKRAMELDPENAMPVAYYGRALQSLGRIEEADVLFRRSLELEPRQGFAYHSLTHNRRVAERERPLVEKMVELSHDAALPRYEALQLEYALGKALEDLGDYDSAMRHFDAANQIDTEIKSQSVGFHGDQLKETADFLIETFDAEFIARHRGMGSDSELPIFVVGMMRSGTTLTEQILSSHSMVGGVGEQPFWADNAGSREKIFASNDSLDAQRLTKLCKSYLNQLETMSPGKSRVVDKMVTNYMLLGLLHIAFPNARILHMRRHPVDTCLSIWATPITHELSFGGEKANVVFAYRQYLRLMEHWRKVLPEDRLLEVRYENLVSDQELWTRRMVEFCGLPWEEACLRPQDNVNSVRTPSVWQVRQPMYKTSMERWRKFESCLGAFAELLPLAEN